MIQISPAEYAEFWPVQCWEAMTPLEAAMAAGLAPRTEAIFARIDHGRWIVDCPDCGGAQLACLADHRFMCNECANIAIGVLWRPVIWPTEARDISAIIGDRTDRKRQNYVPGETLAELREQNAALANATVIDGITILPVVPVDGTAGAVASEHEKHEHLWPKRVEPRTEYECPDCGLTLAGATIAKARDEVRTPAQRAQDERVRREKGERS